MNRRFFLVAAAAAAAMSLSAGLDAQELRPEAFDLLDLDWPGLEQVKALHSEGRDSAAAVALLDYYRGRDIRTPEIKDIKKIGL